MFVAINTYSEANKLQAAYISWKDAFDLYQYGMYEECLEDYAKVNQYFNTNGIFLVNYGKALSISENHNDAVIVLEQSKKYFQNTVTYTTLGDSYDYIGKYRKAELFYSKAHYMSPDRFYAYYLLAKHYESVGKNKKAMALAQQIINKTAKVHSIAVEEIKKEMETLISRVTVTKDVLTPLSNKLIEIKE